MRSQIELFKIHHNDLLPGEEGMSPLDPALVPTTTASFETALISKTNQAGQVGTTALHRFGPYMRGVPTNPFNDLDTVEVDGTAGGSDFAWHLTTTPVTSVDRGLFQADDNGINAVTSVPHIDY